MFKKDDKKADTRPYGEPTETTVDTNAEPVPTTQVPPLNEDGFTVSE